MKVKDIITEDQVVVTVDGNVTYDVEGNKITAHWKNPPPAGTATIKMDSGYYGKIRKAIVQAGILDKFDLRPFWSMNYNDVSGYRRRDKTVTRRIAFKDSMIGRTSAAERNKLQKLLTKAFPNAVSLDVHAEGPSKGEYKTDFYVYLREPA